MTQTNEIFASFLVIVFKQHRSIDLLADRVFSIILHFLVYFDTIIAEFTIIASTKKWKLSSSCVCEWVNVNFNYFEAHSRKCMRERWRHIDVQLTKNAERLLLLCCSLCLSFSFPGHGWISHHAFNKRFRGPRSMMVFTFPSHFVSFPCTSLLSVKL